jgi:hypothetical protein
MARILFSGCLLFAYHAGAINPGFGFAKGFGGSDFDYALGVAVDDAGNIYTTGGFSGTVDFDSGPGTAILTSANGSNIYVQKLDSDGNHIWARSMAGTASSDRGNAVAVDASGNVFTTGLFRETVDFDPGPGTANLTSAGGFDIFVQKLDSAGNLAWAISMGDSSFSDVGHDIAVDGSGNVHIAGEFFGTVDFDPGAGTAFLTSQIASSPDIFVQKLDNDGSLVWARAMGGANQDVAYGIAVDPLGNVYTTGDFQGTADFDPGPGAANLSTTLGSLFNTDTFVSKLDVNGDYVWAKRLTGTRNQRGNSITVDGSGNVLTTGEFEGTMDFDPNIGTVNLTSTGLLDAFISKLDSDGNYVWARAFGGTQDDISYQIKTDPAGNVYTAGYFSDTVDFKPGFGTANRTSEGLTDIFVQKLSPTGTFLWVGAVGGTDFDVAYGVAIDVANDPYITGRFAGTVDFNPGPGINNITEAGNTDFFVAKFIDVTIDMPTASGICLVILSLCILLSVFVIYKRRWIR